MALLLFASGEGVIVRLSPDLIMLAHFIAVAEELSFTQAAERLHMSQQALSKSIRQLERELGAALLERSTRHVELTDAGEPSPRLGADAVA